MHLIKAIKTFFRALFVFGVLLSCAFAQNPLEGITNLNLTGKPSASMDPAGYFSAVIPSQFFTCKLEPKNIECVGLLAVKALLTIKVKEVPITATAALISLNDIEQYEQLSHFKLLRNVKTSIDGIAATLQTFAYDELNNVERPVWMQILNAVQGTHLLVAQLQCGSNTCYEYAAAIDQVFSTLKFAPLDKSGKPLKGKLGPAQNGTAKDLDAIVKELEF